MHVAELFSGLDVDSGKWIAVLARAHEGALVVVVVVVVVVVDRKSVV